MHVCEHRDPLCLLRRLAIGARFDAHPTIQWRPGDENSIHRAYLEYLKKVSESLAEQANVMLEEPCELCEAYAKIVEIEAKLAEYHRNARPR